MSTSKSVRCPRCGLRLRADEACTRCLLELGLLDGDRPAEPGASDPGGAPVGVRSGRYRIQGLLGEGGMGHVYRATAELDPRHPVAVKVIKADRVRDGGFARFEAERAILGRMEHPDVPALHDRGTTGDGLPFFAMELIDGGPITEHCDRRRLGVGERLQLFARVCRAVDHVHARGYVHRDLKPANVLVRCDGGRWAPSLIDFGVATERPRHPRPSADDDAVRTLIGTPAYMSPEQACPSGSQVDRTTDVYSLGVLLYELLCGALPFPAERLRAAGSGEVARILREERPKPPSLALVAHPRSARRTARCRGLHPVELRRRLEGELDRIVLRTLAKDPGRRHPSARQLAAAVERHLDSYPASLSRFSRERALISSPPPSPRAASRALTSAST